MGWYLRLSPKESPAVRIAAVEQTLLILDMLFFFVFVHSHLMGDLEEPFKKEYPVVSQIQWWEKLPNVAVSKCSRNVILIDENMGDWIFLKTFFNFVTWLVKS